MKDVTGRFKWELIITIVISITSVFVAIKANSISEMQAEIARNSALPMFEVEEKIKENSEGAWKESSVIEISNLSGKMNNYQAEVITFLRCGYFGSETAEYELVDVPIENFYLLNVKEGVGNGRIERKDSAGNYTKLKKLINEILLFNKENKNGQNIDPRVLSYLKISYLDLLNEKQELYYLLDTIDIKMIDSDVGQTQFDKYAELTERDFCVNTNQFDEVTVNEVLAAIEGILLLEDTSLVNQNIEDMEGNEIGILSESNIPTILGAVIGFLGTVLGGYMVYWKEKRNKESFAAAILFNDLKSIERYLLYERSSVNIRYSSDWQHMVADCSFLNDTDIEWVFELYDEVYNYNYHYKYREQFGKAVRKEDLVSYGNLKNKMFDTSNGYPDMKKHSKEYEELLHCLQKKKK